MLCRFLTINGAEECLRKLGFTYQRCNEAWPWLSRLRHVRARVVPNGGGFWIEFL